MSVDSLTLGDLKQLRGMLAGDSRPPPFDVGQNYFVETVTKYFLGRLVSADDRWLVLDEASWIADTGRYNEALRDGTASEVEPCPGRVVIGCGAVVSVQPWTKPLLRVVK